MMKTIATGHKNALRALFATAVIMTACAGVRAQAVSFDSPQTRPQSLSEAVRAVEPPAIPVPAAANKAAAAPIKEASVYWDFDSAEVAKHSLVIISICGMDFSTLKLSEPAPTPTENKLAEWKQTKAAVEFLYPGKYNAQKLEEFDQKTVAAFNREIVTERASGRYAGAVAQVKAAHNDTYMEDWINSALKEKNVLVVPFRWTRNPNKSDQALADFNTWLPQVYDAAQKAHKPLYIVAHSWGTLLSYTMLKSLMQASSPIHLDRFVTVGSPLVPSTTWVDALVSAGILYEGLAYYIDPLTNVGPWINLLAKRDPFASVVPAANKNIQVDASADPYEDEVNNAYKHGDSATSAQAAKDLKLFSDISTWHSSYGDNIHLVLPSINKTLDIDVVHDYLIPDALY